MKIRLLTMCLWESTDGEGSNCILARAIHHEVFDRIKIRALYAVIYMVQKPKKSREQEKNARNSCENVVHINMDELRCENRVN